VGNGGGMSRGDRNRNERLARLRALVPVSNAIVGIDLADNKQLVVVCDHDSRTVWEIRDLEGVRPAVRQIATPRCWPRRPKTS
jgi:hypothetical protein